MYRFPKQNSSKLKQISVYETINVNKISITKQNKLNFKTQQRFYT
jgi:hypothetical protein